MSEPYGAKEGKPLLWKDRYTVKSYDVDQEKRITLSSLFNCFQESASHHAGRCDLGYKSLRERGLFWVLSRLRIEIKRLLLWEEEFTVETWSKGAEGIFAVRDFLVAVSDRRSYAMRGHRTAADGGGWPVDVIRRGSRWPDPRRRDRTLTRSSSTKS